jgi:hypothetical protein
MSAATRQANFLLPIDLIEEIKNAVSKREQSKFVAAALRKELNRLRLEKTLKTSFGTWTAAYHPELKDGTDAYVRNIRKSSRAGRQK